MNAKQTDKYFVCNTCTIKLVNLCRERKWWFYYFRLPLVMGMRILAAWHRIDPRDYNVRSDVCYGCIRFMKTALKEQSPTFRFLNDRINPVFDKVVGKIVTTEEILEAKHFAKTKTQPSENIYKLEE